jgi:hypothetical protein
LLDSVDVGDFGEGCGAAVAGHDVDVLDEGRLEQFPGDGMLPAAVTDNENAQAWCHFVVVAGNRDVKNCRGVSRFFDRAELPHCGVERDEGSANEVIWARSHWGTRCVDKVKFWTRECFSIAHLHVP